MPRKKTDTLNAQNSGEEAVKDTGKILQLVVFKLDGEDYAANIEDVVEVVKIPEVTPLPNSLII